MMNQQLSSLFLIVISIGIVLEGTGLWAHYINLKPAHNEGAASFYEQTTQYGYSYWFRNILLLAAGIISISMFLTGTMSLWVYVILSISLLLTAVLGRALFYVVVIPTTMPGAFFWKNKGFVEHARETGLAEMPQIGVVYEKHHKFNIDELINTIITTTFQAKISQLKRLFSG